MDTEIINNIELMKDYLLSQGYIKRDFVFIDDERIKELYLYHIESNNRIDKRRKEIKKNPEKSIEKYINLFRPVKKRLL